MFADPKKVKIIKYVYHPDQELVRREEIEYKQKLGVIIEEMIHDWLFKNKAQAKTRIERLFNYVKEELKK